MPTAKTYNLKVDEVNVIYSEDFTFSTSYKISKGELIISSVSKEPASLNATFSGWAFKNLNPNDSIYVSQGFIDVSF